MVSYFCLRKLPTKIPTNFKASHFFRGVALTPPPSACIAHALGGERLHLKRFHVSGQAQPMRAGNLPKSFLRLWQLVPAMRSRSSPRASARARCWLMACALWLWHEPADGGLNKGAQGKIQQHVGQAVVTNDCLKDAQICFLRLMACARWLAVSSIRDQYAPAPARARATCSANICLLWHPKIQVSRQSVRVRQNFLKPYAGR